MIGKVGATVQSQMNVCLGPTSLSQVLPSGNFEFNSPALAQNSTLKSFLRLKGLIRLLRGASHYGRMSRGRRY